jgi:hypothetical protein
MYGGGFRNQSATRHDMDISVNADIGLYGTYISGNGYNHFASPNIFLDENAVIDGFEVGVEALVQLPSFGKHNIYNINTAPYRVNGEAINTAINMTVTGYAGQYLDTYLGDANDNVYIEDSLQPFVAPKDNNNQVYGGFLWLQRTLKIEHKIKSGSAIADTKVLIIRKNSNGQQSGFTDVTGKFSLKLIQSVKPHNVRGDLELNWTNYGLYDLYLCKYGYLFQQLNINPRNDNKGFDGIPILAESELLSEVTANEATAIAYTGLSLNLVSSTLTITENRTLSEIVDWLFSQAIANNAQAFHITRNHKPVTKDGLVANFGNINIVVGNGGNISKSSKYTSIKTTGIVSVTGTGAIAIPVIDSTGLGFVFTGLPTTGTAKIKLTDIVGGTSVYITVPNTGIAIAKIDPAKDYQVIADDYLYIRSNPQTIKAGDTILEISLPRIKNPDGTDLIITAPQTEIDCVTFDYASKQFVIAYNPIAPNISANALIAAIEKFQSGNIDNQAFDISVPVRFENNQIIFANNTLLKIKAADTNAANNRPYIVGEIVHQGYDSPRRLLDSFNGRFVDLPTNQVVVVTGTGGVSDLTPVLTGLAAVLDKVDVKTSTRAAPSDVQITGGFTTSDRTALQSKLNSSDYVAPNNNAIASILTNADVKISTRAVASDLQVNVNGGFLGSDRTLLENTLKAANYVNPPTATTIIAALLLTEIDANWSIKKLIRLFSSVLGGKVSQTENTTTFRNLLDTKNAVISTADDASDRASITYNLDD